MPARSMRVKREPVAIEEDNRHDNLLETRTQPATTNMPVRAASVVSTATATGACNGHSNGDTDMADVTDINCTNGTSSTSANAIGIHALGNHSRELIQAIQRLEALNIDATLPSLPKFVVIGDQSAGKSSIIEAVSDITLPRSAGTCTRCPFKITTTAAKQGAPWTCNVSLYFKYAFTGKTRLGAEDGPFIGWAEQKEPDILPFATVTDKNELEITLRRAQLALLNPHKNPDDFLNHPVGPNAADKQRVGFSPNVISLEITAPGLPDLSFYDLPGAINTVADEKDQHLVGFVKRLIKTYVKEDKALILLACAANQDMEVSTAFRYLRDCQACSRAMGVFTKPDLMDQTAHRIETLQDLLSGANYKVEGSWFVTRQRSQQELDQQMVYGEARDVEEAFFSTEPWISQPLSDYIHRFGIANLQNALSEKLTKHILNDIPSITARVHDRLAIVDDQLALLPAKDVSPSLSVIAEIDGLKAKLEKQIDPDSDVSQMREAYRKIWENLSKRLQELQPKVNMTTPGYQKPSISIESSDEDESPSKSVRTSNGLAMSIVNTPSRSARARRTPASSSNSSQGPEGFAVFRLGDVKARFDAASTADLPYAESPTVMRGLILEGLVCVPSTVNDALKSVRELFIQMLDRTVDSALATRMGTEFHRQAKQVTYDLFEELFQNVETTVCEIIAAETRRPITYSAIVKHERALQKARYHLAREERRVAEHFETMEAQGQKMVAKPEQKKKAADAAWVTAILGKDEYDREVGALAMPIAYYKVTTKSLVDMVARLFENGLMHSFHGRISRKLLEDLRATDAEYCAQLLIKDPERERQRAELVAEKAKLEAALKELTSLRGVHVPN